MLDCSQDGQERPHFEGYILIKTRRLQEEGQVGWYRSIMEVGVS
jgi:hypothetical protein